MTSLVQTLHRAGEQAGELPEVAGLGLVTDALELLALSPRDRAVLGFVVALTLRPGSMTREHLGTVRDAGLSDRDAHDVVYVAACFAYMNRLADGLGVSVPQEREAWARQRYGDGGLEAHRRGADPAGG